MANSHIKLIFSVVLLWLIIACTNGKYSPPEISYDGRRIMHDHETEDFHPEQISCTDKSSAEDGEKLKAIREHPQSDLYWTAYINEILALARKVAHQGNFDAIDMFGGFKREYLIAEHLYDKNGDMYCDYC